MRSESDTFASGLLLQSACLHVPLVEHYSQLWHILCLRDGMSSGADNEVLLINLVASGLSVLCMTIHCSVTSVEVTI